MPTLALAWNLICNHQILENVEGNGIEIDMHKCLKKGEVLKKRREARRQKKAAASLDIQNHCPSITFQDNEKDTEQPVLINLQAMSNTDMPGQESIADCVQTLNYSATGIY